jgi:hypothetical protein
VAGGGAGANVKVSTDLLIAQTSGEQAQHVNLAQPACA